MKRIQLTASVLSAILLAGCVSAPVPEGTTQAWAPPKDAQQKDDVWNTIRNQKRDFSKPLTLSDAVDIALQNNPATRKAWNEARVAAAQVKEVQGLFLPTLTGTAGISKNNTSANPDTFDSGSTRYGPGLEINYLIINFGGGRRAAVQQALQTVYALDYNFNRTLQDILLAVEIAYFNLVSAEFNIQAAETSVKDAATSLDAAQTRKGAGTGTQLEVLQAQALSDQAQYNLANAKGLALTARGLLAQAMGIPADIELKPDELKRDIADLTLPKDMTKLIDEALNRRPDIAALRATYAAQIAAIRVANAAYWPSLYFNGSASQNYYEDKTGMEMQEDDVSYGGGLSLRWDFFDGFQTTSRRRAAIARAEAVHAQLEQAELAASAEVWNRYHRYETALEKHKFSKAFLDSTSATYDLALESYKAGIKSILDLLSAESQLAQARSLNIAAREETFSALAQLAHATGLMEKGGSLQLQENLSTPTNKDNQL